MQYTFGSGILIARRTDQSGVVTPIQFGALQEGSIEFSQSTKQLYGQFQFPLAVARGTGKVTGKAKVGSLNGKLVNDLFFDGTQTSGHKRVSYNEAWTIPATPGPYVITAAPPSSGVFAQDGGVIFAATGLPLTRVTSGPTTGQYSLNDATGAYTFASADQGLDVYVSYLYTTTAGTTVTVGNKRLGLQPFFEVMFNRTFDGKESTVRMLRCTSSKLSFATKLEDFEIVDFEFEAFADVAGNIATISFNE
jgi:hypothetical protein